MRIRIQNELALLNIITLLLIIVIIFLPSTILQIVFGLPFVLFLPGYTLIAALFPRKNQLGSFERLAFSFGLSITVVPLIVLILNYTPWGITLYPTLISITIFIVGISLIGWYRRRGLDKLEKLTISLNFSLAPWRGQSLADKILSIILTVAILGAIGTLGYAIASPKVGEKFTEFYILGVEGEATGYHRELVAGEETKVIVGIVNHEHETASYRVELAIDGMRNNEVGPLVLQHDAKWEETVTFTLDRGGDNQKVEFLLYKNGESELYLEPLYLWIDVKE